MGTTGGGTAAARSEALRSYNRHTFTAFFRVVGYTGRVGFLGLTFPASVAHLLLTASAIKKLPEADEQQKPAEEEASRSGK